MEIFLKKCQNLHFPRAFQQNQPYINVYTDSICVVFLLQYQTPVFIPLTTTIKRKRAQVTFPIHQFSKINPFLQFDISHFLFYWNFIQ